MKRTFAIGDIHGGLKALIQVLDKAKITADDTLIFLGDYVDGWSQSAGVISYLIELQKTNKCIFIKGNHDIWCEDWLESQKKDDFWLLHGGILTIESYTDQHDKSEHLEFFKNMKNYYLDEQNRLFTHAGFSSMHGVSKEPYDSNFSWDRTLWELALVLKETKLDKSSPFYPKRLKHYHEIYIGHTPTTNYNINEPIEAHNVINVDTGAAFRGRLCIMDIDTKQFWQSDPLPELYPDEKGRN